MLAEVSEASVADAEELSALAIKTYVETFGAEFDPEELAWHLDQTISVPRWQDYLSRDRIFIARIGGRAVGYVQFGPAKADGAIEIRRLYVDADFQQQGVGSDLLRRALEDPIITGAASVIIDVWEHNHRARQLYERFGFRHEGGLEPFILKSGEIDGYDLILVRRA